VRSLLAERRPPVLAGAALFAVLVVVVLALVGRSEKDRWVDSELHGMTRVDRLVGPLDQRSLVGFRVLPQFDCLVYRRGLDLLALELCVNGEGRLVQAIDRRGGGRHYFDLESDPSTASIRVDRAEVDRLLRKMGAIG
jgi:hypothetical protein